MEKISVLDMYFGDAFGNPDFVSIKASGFVGIIHRASFGSSFIDPSHNTRRAAAVAAGLQWGSYHTLDASDINAQLTNFLARVDFNIPTCLVADFTNGPEPAALHQLYSFCSVVNHNSPPQYQCAIRADDYIRTVLFDRPTGGYVSQSMIGYIGYLQTLRLWMNDKLPVASYKTDAPFPWASLWLRRYELPFGAPAFRIGHVYNGDAAVLPDHWVA